MFSIGFFELLLVVLVSIVVLKPEDMIYTARTLGVVFAKFYRFYTETKTQITNKLNQED